MHDSVQIWLPNEQKTAFTAASLAQTLYHLPVTVSLDGELGAGKTTFVQGFAHGLGISEPITSPTFALEQRYALPSRKGFFIHIDLYRLSPRQVGQLLLQTEHDHAIRCIEWSDRLPSPLPDPCIRCRISHAPNNSRMLECRFDDMALPTREDVEAWRREVRLPAHIVDHCERVAQLCHQFANALLTRGHLLRPLALQRAAEVHDLLRFIDFRKNAEPTGFQSDPEAEQLWTDWKAQYGNLKHEQACAKFLTEHGFPELGDIVKTHGLTLGTDERMTIEQKILYYADKRALNDRNVTLEERFADFANRYGNGQVSDAHRTWYAESQAVEKELFPDGPPV